MAISQEAPPSAAPQQTGQARRTREGRFDIDFGERLPGLDSPQAQAFVAHDVELAQGLLFALVCNPNVQTRIDVADQLERLEDPGLLGMAGVDSVASPGEDHVQRFAIILERPVNRLVPLGATEHRPFDEKTIFNVVLPPVLSALSMLHRKRIAHRAIRPDNLFYLDIGQNAVALGECVSAPPGFDQPVAFEPIERAMASQTGRGEGTPACDMYAVGATIVSLLAGRQPAVTSERDHILERLEAGSTAAMLRNLTPSSAMRDLLAGLLYDDPDMRWTAEDAGAWLSGRHKSSRFFQASHDGIRPYRFLNRDYTSPRAIAFAMTQDPEAARQALRDDRLVDWLTRSYGDPDKAAAVSQIAGKSDGEREEQGLIDESAVASVCAVLDPTGPMRYRGQAVMLDGFGHALAHATLNQRHDVIKALERCLLKGLPLLTLRQLAPGAKRQQWEATFRALQGFVKNRSLDTGIERCLYELNPDMPCLSPLVRGHLALTLKQVLLAINDAARSVNAASTRPRDRHVATFIASRLPINERQNAAGLTERAPVGAEEIVSDLAVLTEVQQYANGGAVPKLAHWLAERLGPVIHAFHSRARRARVRDGVKQAVETGDLRLLLRVALDKRERALDEQEHNAVLARYAAFGASIERLKTMFANREQLAVAQGRRVAMAIAMVVLLIACISATMGGVP